MTDPQPGFYRQPPEGPSPRWKRAADGLRLVRIALLAQIALSVLGRVVHGYGQIHLFRDGAATGLVEASLVAAQALHWVAFPLLILSAVGQWRFAQAPSSTQIPAPARAALRAQVVMLVVPLLTHFLSLALVRSLGANPVMFSLGMMGLGLLGVVLYAVWLTQFFSALDHARKAAGGAMPEWAPALIAGTIAWHITGLLSGALQVLFTRTSQATHATLLAAGLAVDVALALALVRLVRLAEQALARQLAPASEVG